MQKHGLTCFHINLRHCTPTTQYASNKYRLSSQELSFMSQNTICSRNKEQSASSPETSGSMLLLRGNGEGSKSHVFSLLCSIPTVPATAEKNLNFQQPSGAFPQGGRSPRLLSLMCLRWAHGKSGGFSFNCPKPELGKFA